jgi:hypothetical protein
MPNGPFKRRSFSFSGGAPYQTRQQRVTQQRMNVMTSKISGILAAALILASASVASAATVHKAGRHYQEHRGAVMLLQDNGARGAAAAGTNAAENFQNNWDVSY